MNEVQLKLNGLSVMIAMPTHRDIPWQTTVSLLETYALLSSRGIPCDVQIAANCSLVELSRMKLAHQFLESDANRLFWVDSDIVWNAEDFLRVLALTSVMPIVGGAYPVKQDKVNFYIASDPAGVSLNEYGCMPIDGFGIGFTCVTREVMETLADRANKVTCLGNAEPLPQIFKTDVRDGRFVGEDIAFFADAKAAGFPVHLDPNVRLGHIGSKTFSASVADYLRT